MGTPRTCQFQPRVPCNNRRMPALQRQGADPGFWFGMGTSRESGGQKSLKRGQEAEPRWVYGGDAPRSPNNVTCYFMRLEQELSYCKQIARQLRTQFVEGISVTLKSTLRVTQGHWKRNHWTDHTRLTVRRVIGR